MSTIIFPQGVTAHQIDFSTTPLAGYYDGFFALVLENIFTPSECASLLSLATSAHAWEHTAPDHRLSGFRDHERIFHDDFAAAEAIFERVAPFIPAEVTEIGPDSRWVGITGTANQNWSKARGETGFWQMKRVNERLRFLRYSPGNHFRPHCDSLFEYTPAGSAQMLKSFLSMMVYLNDGVQGGTTRFWSPDRMAWLDIEPKVGRVLVYQQRLLSHSAEEVVSGVKLAMRADLFYERVVVTREQRRIMQEQEAARLGYYVDFGP